MKEDVMTKLRAVYSALGNVSVSGMQNLSNLAGSMSILENVLTTLSNCEITPIDDAGNAAELK